MDFHVCCALNVRFKWKAKRPFITKTTTTGRSLNLCLRLSVFFFFPFSLSLSFLFSLSILLSFSFSFYSSLFSLCLSCKDDISQRALFVFLQGQRRLTVDKRSQDGHIICPVIFWAKEKKNSENDAVNPISFLAVVFNTSISQSWFERSVWTQKIKSPFAFCMAYWLVASLSEVRSEGRGGWK